MSEQAKSMPQSSPLFARGPLDANTVAAIVEWLRWEAHWYRENRSFRLIEKEACEHNGWLLDRTADSLAEQCAERARRGAKARARSVKGDEHG